MNYFANILDGGWEVVNLGNYSNEYTNDIDSIINLNDNLIYEYQKELKKNTIKVICCINMWIVTVHFFNYYINYQRDINFDIGLGINDID